MLPILLLLAAAVGPQDVAAEGLTEARHALRAAETVEARVAALEALAALDTPGAPSPEVAEAVAEGLRDEADLVRLRAVELLGAGLHRETAVSALVGAVRDQVREEQELVRRLKELAGGIGPLDSVQRSSEELLEQAHRISEAMRAVMEAAESCKDLPRVREALVQALAKLPDDRSVMGLAELLGKDHGPSVDPVLDALLGFGTANALEPVVGVMHALEGATMAGYGAIGRAKAQEPAPWTGPQSGKADWERREYERIAREAGALEERVAELSARGETLRGKLAAFARKHGLPETPEQVMPAQAWDAWLDHARQHLPASLGRLGSTSGR